MRRIRTTAMALLTVLAMAISSGVGPARADTTGFSFEFFEPSAPHAVGTCNNFYCTSFPYGVWTPIWQLRAFPAPGGTPTPVQVQWMVGEVKPTDPKHLVAGIDLQIDMGHGWQEAPDGPTTTVTIPATATFGSPYIFYFRFKPIVDAQQAVRVCATLLWKGAPAQPQGGQWSTNSCTDDLVFTGTPPAGQPSSAPTAAHTPSASLSRSTTPAPPTPTTTSTPTPAPTTTATSTPTTAVSPGETTSPAPSDKPSSEASVAPAAQASSPSAPWAPVLLGAIGIVVAGGVTATVLAHRRRGRTSAADD